MSSRYPPLTYKDVVNGLKKMGFEPRKQRSTSHEHWVKVVENRLYKVTVDRPKEPFTGDLIRSMAAQAGVSKADFYKACRS